MCVKENERNWQIRKVCCCCCCCSTKKNNGEKKMFERIYDDVWEEFVASFCCCIFFKEHFQIRMPKTFLFLQNETLSQIIIFSAEKCFQQILMLTRMHRNKFLLYTYVLKFVMDEVEVCNGSVKWFCRKMQD
jgi:hypothetical protein